MQAMVLEEQKKPLVLKDIPIPEPSPHQVRIRIEACGVCRTDLHVVDGDLHNPKLPLVPGHEIVGVVDKCGESVHGFSIGQKVGVPWLGYTCGKCRYCKLGMENLCENALFTGYTIDGGYAEYTVADERYCFPLPASINPVESAPLLCAGLIGYRSYNMVRNAETIGLYGFGAAAHIIAQISHCEGKKIYAFTRPKDKKGQEFARSLGAVWASDSLSCPPQPLDAAIIFAPVGPLVPRALEAIRKGGTVVCAGIYMTDIPSFPYEILWNEKIIRSVANLTRKDGLEFFDLLNHCKVHTYVTPYPLEKANEALDAVRKGVIEGAAVLKIVK